MNTGRVSRDAAAADNWARVLCPGVRAGRREGKPESKARRGAGRRGAQQAARGGEKSVRENGGNVGFEFFVQRRLFWRNSGNNGVMVVADCGII